MARIVGVGPDLIDVRIVYLPLSFREARGLERWKLLAEASESLSYAGVGVAFLDADAEKLWGRD